VNTETYPGGLTEAQVRQLADPAVLAPYVQSVVTATTKDKPGKSLLVAYIDALACRAIADRLLGPLAWEEELTLTPMPLPNGNGYGAVARVTLHTVHGSRHRDSAGGNDSLQPDTGYKGSDSDAKKRAWMRWGLGVALARLSQEWVPNEQRGNGKPRPQEAAVNRVLAKWRKDLEKMGEQFARQVAGEAAAHETPREAVVERGAEGSIPTTPLSSDEPAEAAPPPAQPEAQPTPAPVPSTPEEKPAEAAQGIPTEDVEFPKGEPPSADTPAGGPVNAAEVKPEALDAGAKAVGAPGTGTTWQERATWARERFGGKDAVKALLEDLGDRPYESRLGQDPVWAMVVNHALENEQTTNQEAA
jgi:hypothetical protein